MNHQFGKSLLRKGFQALLVTLIMFFLTNMLTPLKAATWQGETERQRAAPTDWPITAASVNYASHPLGNPLKSPLHSRAGKAQSGYLEHVSSSIVVILLVTFCCGGILSIAWSLKLTK
ncbi:hypothetical protein [Motilimonas eburnea]|uniref:hypothetical protein n=1 Tax=Motilimonas eburnea TaxID=1737488 RepID=UPI001E309A30|nr:hypothetical protein [Motilimonas eburnea]MCE2570495.1 hypothetical protein [Motilimonas eburnea]